MSTATTTPASTINRSQRFGSRSARFVAFLIDTTLFLFCYTIVLYSATSEAQHLYTWQDMLQDTGMSFTAVLLLCKMLFFNLYFPGLHWLYYTLLESSPKQATIGKFTLGLRVTDLRGRRISFGRANLRYFARIVSVAPFFLGFVLLLTTRRRQALHDYLARTVVVAE